MAYFEDFDMVALDALLLAQRAARANDLEGIAVGSFSVALLFAVLGREQLAMGYVSRALQAAERHGDPLTLAQARQGGAVVALAQGGRDDVRMLAEPSMHVSAEVGDLHVWPASAALLMRAAAHHGDLARARDLAAEVERAGAESGNLQIRGWGLGLLSLVNHLDGDAEAAVRLAEASVAELRRVPDHLTATVSLGALARAQLRAGHPDAAASTIAQVSAEVERRGFRGLYTAYQVEAAAEYALLSLATDNSAATRKPPDERSAGRSVAGMWRAGTPCTPTCSKEACIGCSASSAAPSAASRARKRSRSNTNGTERSMTRPTGSHTAAPLQASTHRRSGRCRIKVPHVTLPPQLGSDHSDSCS